jgi:hypothetical protein
MKTTPDKVVRVAEKHIKLYENRIRIKETGLPGAQYINLEECKKYLRIWLSIKAKDGQNLSPEEAAEVADAYYSGEYDDIFKETN